MKLAELRSVSTVAMNSTWAKVLGLINYPLDVNIQEALDNYVGADERAYESGSTGTATDMSKVSWKTLEKEITGVYRLPGNIDELIVEYLRSRLNHVCDLDEFLRRLAQEYDQLRMFLYSRQTLESRVDEKFVQPFIECFLRDVRQRLSENGASDMLDVKDVRGEKDLTLTCKVAESKGCCTMPIGASTSKTVTVKGKTDVGLFHGEVLRNNVEAKQSFALKGASTGVRTQSGRQLLAETESIGRSIDAAADIDAAVAAVLIDGFACCLDLRLGMSTHMHDRVFVTDARSIVLRLCLLFFAVRTSDLELTRDDDLKYDVIVSRKRGSEATGGPSRPDDSLLDSSDMRHSNDVVDYKKYDDMIPYPIEFRGKLEVDEARRGRILLSAPNLALLGATNFEEHPNWTWYAPWVRDLMVTNFELRIGDSYKFVGRIDGGAGVYEALDSTLNGRVAVKLEPLWIDREGEYIFEPAPLLDREIEVYNVLTESELSRPPGIARVFAHGRQGEYAYLVMELLGSSLSSILKSRGHFQLSEALEIATELLCVLEYIHSKGILHRDVKPSNICRGGDDRSDESFIIDFNVAQRFVDASGRRVPLSERHEFVGTHQFASRAAHFGIEQCPSDDLESLAYTLLTLLGVDSGNEPMATQSSASLCEGQPNEIQSFLDECRGTTDLEDTSHFKLRFEKSPDYARLRQLLDDARRGATKRVKTDVITTPSPPSTDSSPETSPEGINQRQ